MVESVIETAFVDRDRDGNPLPNDKTPGYFSIEEDRILDNMMFGTSSPESEGTSIVFTGADGGTEGMEYGESDLSTQFSSDAARGRHSYDDRGDNGNDPATGRHRQESSALVLTSASHAREEERRRGRISFAARWRRAIRQSIMRSSKAVPTMRFPQTLACGMVFLCRAITKNPWCNAASFVGAR